MSSSTISSVSTSSATEFSYSNATGASSPNIIDLSTEFIATATTTAVIPPDPELSVAYTASEALVSFFAIFGNALVVHVFCTNRSLRRYRNYYIVALAIADFLVGLLGIPFAILASVGLPKTNLYGCLFTVSILIVLCTVSILCLVAVSIDRYWATTNPFAYYRNMTTTTAVGIILCCWFVGTIIGFLPLFGWRNDKGWIENEHCYFTKVMDYNYLVFLYFATIVFPALLMAGFYGYIYHVVLIKIRQRGTLAPQGRRPSEQSRSGSLNSDNRGSTQMMRIMVSEKRREGKAAKKLGIIVLFFMICWMPLYTINCVQAFCPDCQVPLPLLNFTIILSHVNSALNPFLYAYHLKEFRVAMKNSLCSLFGFMLCGYVNTQSQKDPFYGGVSRSQTMPSLANASLSTQTGKFSIKFRKVPGPEDSRKEISPRECILLPLVSKDNVFATVAAAEKSLTSFSMRENNVAVGGKQDEAMERASPDKHCINNSGGCESFVIASPVVGTTGTTPSRTPTAVKESSVTNYVAPNGDSNFKPTNANNVNKCQQQAILETHSEPIEIQPPQHVPKIDSSQVILEENPSQT